MSYRSSEAVLKLVQWEPLTHVFDSSLSAAVHHDKWGDDYQIAGFWKKESKI